MRCKNALTGWKLLTEIFALFIIAAAAQLQAEESASPNIILMIADDMAWDDCGAYGHPHIQTPNLDRLAAEGMRFDRAYLTCSSCSPSRSSIITGRYPHSTGGAHQLHNPLPAEQKTFVEQLKQHGYYTAIAGKIHPRKTTVDRFEKVYGMGPAHTGGSGEWLKCLQECPEDRPFFLWLASTDPHRGYSPNAIENPHTINDVVIPPYLPDVPEVRQDLALYYDEITRLDSYVGKILDELAEQNLAENTVVVFISDNGRPFPRCKTTLYDSGIKTPFLVRWPGQIAAGSHCDSLVSTVDLAPTFCRLAGVEPNPTYQGVDVSPLFKNPEQKVRDYVFAEHNWHDYEDHQRACHSERYHYIRTAYTDFPGTPPADAVKSISFQMMHKLKALGLLTPAQATPYLEPRPAEEFYDLKADPHELKNLAEDPKYAQDLNKHRKRLNQWIQETDDVIPAERRPNEFDRVTGERLKPPFKN